MNKLVYLRRRFEVEGNKGLYVLSPLLSILGATPVDQSKVGFQDGEEEDPDE